MTSTSSSEDDGSSSEDDYNQVLGKQLPEICLIFYLNSRVLNIKLLFSICCLFLLKNIIPK